jgi:ferric-dicitrate binding protein FerR (iron transport regulator)
VITRRLIERYAEAGLPGPLERLLRRHLGRCGVCRRYYEEQLLLVRALHGDVTQPTAEESARLTQRVLAATGPEASAARGGGRRLLLAGAAATVAVAGLGLWLAQPAPEVARLARANGVQLDGAAPADADVVRAGQRIDVPAGGAALLRLTHGGQVRVFAGTTLRLADGDETAELERGKVWCIIEGRHHGFRVRTAEGVASVTGTSFIVERHDTVTAVRVIGGTVRVEDHAATGRVDVERGQQTQVSREGPPAPPHGYAPERDRDDWNRAWKQLLRRVRGAVDDSLDHLRDALH